MHHFVTHLLMAILVIAAVRWIFAARCRTRATTNMAPLPDSRSGAREDLAKLRERIATLERITVDERGSSSRLAAEIDALRD